MERTGRVLMFFIVLVIAACANEEATPSVRRPNPTSRPVLVARPATNDCGGTNVGSAQSNPTDIEIEPPEGAGELGEEEDEGLNEGEQPALYVDPDAVTPDGSSLTRTADQPDSAVGTPEGIFVHRIDRRIDKQNGLLEPDIAVSGTRTFVTWNTNAAISNDSASSATSLRYLNPGSGFPAAGASICCDQRVIRIERFDMWLWLMQYQQRPDDSNVIRIASVVGEANLARGSFNYTDWTAADLGLPASDFLDQAKLAATDEHFFISVNAFRKGVGQTMLIRGRLDDLAANSGAIRTRCVIPTFEIEGNRSSVFGAHPTRGATDTMYLGAMVTTSELGVWRWRDSEDSPEAFRVNPRLGGEPLAWHQGGSGGYQCPRVGAPQLSDWCRRPASSGPGYSNDSRLTSGWVSGNRLGFSWNVAQNPSSQINFPYVDVVEIDATRLESCTDGSCVLALPVIYSPDFAYQWAAIHPNANGELGGVVLAGGGSDFQSCKAIVRDGKAPADGWSTVELAASNDDLPREKEYNDEGEAVGETHPRVGDYLGITAAADGLTWLGTCMTWSKASGTSAGSYVLHIGAFGRGINDPGR